MTGSHCSLLKKSQTVSYWSYGHRLTGQKDAMQTIQKMNSTASYADIIQQNKIWQLVGKQ